MVAPYETPLWLEALPGDDAVTYGARQDRAVIDAVFPVAGVLSTSAWSVSQHAAGANFQVDVAAGLGVIAGNAIANSGKFLARSVAATSVTIAPPFSSGSRTDLIVAQILDPQSDPTAQGVYGWTFLAVKGADNAGTVPAVPKNALLLAQITVPAGAPSITAARIADRRPMAQGVGDTGYWLGTRTTLPRIAAMTGGNFITFGLWDQVSATPDITTDGNGSIFTVAAAGIYVVRGQISYGPEDTPVGQRVVRLYFNGSLVNETASRADNAINTQLFFFGMGRLAAGDTIHVETYQSQGADTQLALTSGQCRIEIERR